LQIFSVTPIIVVEFRVFPMGPDKKRLSLA
jgi:hypothetical protein